LFVDHIAVLTTDLRRQSDALPSSCRKEAIESFPAEGTREQYVELAERVPRLLLLQPIGAGPYSRALKKRGPGLHHVGVKTQSIKALVPRISELGLLMHPISIQTIEHGVAWLCRPGVPFLIEVAEGKVGADSGAFDLGLPAGHRLPDFVEHMFSNARIHEGSTDHLELKAGDRLVRLPLV
jgi:hypothetical protein